MLFTFGREDQLDKNAIRRLVVSLAKLLDPGDALVGAATIPTGVAGEGLEYVATVPFGGAMSWTHCGTGSRSTRSWLVRGSPRVADAVT